jgi:transcriptional regulator with XRE-family HTH domain
MIMDEIDYFRIALKHLVKERGGQSNVALDSGLSEGYISQIVNGKRKNPSRRTLTNLSAALKTAYHDMIALGKDIAGHGNPKAPTPPDDLLSHTVKMQDIRLAALQDTVNKLQAALQKLTDDTGHEIGEIKNRMIDTASSGDYHRLDPTRPFRN